MVTQLHVVTNADDHIFGDALAGDVAIRSYLEPLKKYLGVAGVTELCINRPGEIIIEVQGDKRVISEPSLTYGALEAFANAIAVYAQQSIGPTKPLLSATLPDGERVQIVLPPAVEPGIINFTIRVPGTAVIPIESYTQSGAFSSYLWARPEDLEQKLQVLEGEDRALAFHLAVGRLDFFITEAIKAKKNIAVVGDTGSGKTTLMKSMCQSIPFQERLITIEDVRELWLPSHIDKAHLLYSKNNQGAASITPSDLISSCMRMYPSRVLLAELRGGEAWDFLKLLSAGHSGSITSFHAESCSLAFERFMFMSKENEQASSLSRAELLNLVNMTLDVVIHVKREVVPSENGKGVAVRRYVDEVHFDPWAKMAARFAGKETAVKAAHFAEVSA